MAVAPVTKKQTNILYCNSSQSRWPRGLKRGSVGNRFLGLRVRIPPGVWLSLFGECCVLSGRGIYDGPIIHLEESYRVRRV